MTIDELHDFLRASTRGVQDNVLGLRSSTGKPRKAGPSHAERHEPRTGAIARRSSPTEWDNWKSIRDVV